MILISQNELLSLVLKIAVEGKDYTVFISSDHMQCFLCGEHGHLRQTCPSKQDNVSDVAASQTIPKNNVKENSTAIHEVIDEQVERNVTLGSNESTRETNNVNTGVHQPADGAARANVVEKENAKAEPQKVHSQSKDREDEDLVMEYVEANDKKGE